MLEEKSMELMEQQEVESLVQAIDRIVERQMRNRQKVKVLKYEIKSEREESEDARDER